MGFRPIENAKIRYGCGFTLLEIKSKVRLETYSFENTKTRDGCGFLWLKILK